MRNSFARKSIILAAALAALALAIMPVLAGPPVRAGTESDQKLQAPDERDTFRFLIFGDRTGGPPEGIAVLAEGVKMANRLNVDFVSTVGDLVEGYNAPELWIEQMQEYKDTMAGLNMPWYPVPGNHDVYARPKKEGGNTDLFQKHFGPLYYSFDYKWAHFIVLFSDEKLSFSEPAKNQNMSPEQLNWLREDLASTNAEQIYAFLHHPRWEPRYDGCNWDDVHQVFVKDGRPTTIFGGHIHMYRDDGVRDNVHYYALATTGAHLTRYRASASLHHVTFVTAERSRTTVAVLPMGTVYAGDFILGEEVNAMDRLARGDWLFVDGTARIGLGPGSISTFQGKLTNTTEEPVQLALDVLTPEGWEATYQRVNRTISPGETVALSISVVAPAVSATRPDLKVRGRAFYRLKSGLVEPIEILADVPVKLDVPDAECAATPENNGVLKLDGKSAVRVGVDERLDKFTLECWVRGSQPTGRAGLITKTEGSDYGIFWSDDADGATLPVAFVGTQDGYLKLPTKQAWDWSQWTHVALVFDGEKGTLYVNGQPQAEQTTKAKRRYNELPLYIGADPDNQGEPNSFFTGEIDEVRLSFVPRYNGAFKPQRVFARDEDTLALYHFDRETKGVALDDSGTGHHGWLFGAPQIERTQR